jgi:hypothetical protein
MYALYNTYYKCIRRLVQKESFIQIKQKELVLLLAARVIRKFCSRRIEIRMGLICWFLNLRLRLKQQLESHW